MTAKIVFFPVDCGDMNLLELHSEAKVLVDINVRTAADDPEDPTPDVIAMLKARLKKDAEGRSYVDAFLLSHPDQDHCRGFAKHFYVGDPQDYPAGSEKIFIRELWSSPVIFRRASEDAPLCEDAKAFTTEARRRVKKYRTSGGTVGDGDRIQILGEDIDGKTADLTAILVKVDEEIVRVNGVEDATFRARLLAPLPKEEADEETTKNDESVIMRFTLDGAAGDQARFLTGGDAGVLVWEALWERNENRKDRLEYDILLAPHHCSWHSLSHDSWSEKGDDAKVSPDARDALGQAREGADVVASCKPISDDDSDPPCIRAKQEYEDIVDAVDGSFLCVMEAVSDDDPQPIEFEVKGSGVSRIEVTRAAKAAAMVIDRPTPMVIERPSKPWVR